MRRAARTVPRWSRWHAASRRSRCFCTNFGVDPAEPEGRRDGVDRRVDEMYLRANTEKGEALLAGA